MFGIRFSGEPSLCVKLSLKITPNREQQLPVPGIEEHLWLEGGILRMLYCCRAESKQGEQLQEELKAVLAAVLFGSLSLREDPVFSADASGAPLCLVPPPLGILCRPSYLLQRSVHLVGVHLEEVGNEGQRCRAKEQLSHCLPAPYFPSQVQEPNQTKAGQEERRGSGPAQERHVRSWD